MWTAKTTAKMKSLMEQGWTARRIAQELGPRFTRSAVIGKWNRMGLISQRTIDRQKNKATKEPNSNTVVSYRKFSSQAPKGILFDQLTPKTCRYPISGEGRQMRFCGDTTDDRTYCQHHHKITRVAGTAYKAPALMKAQGQR